MTGLINENPETPVKTKQLKSLSSSICDNADEEDLKNSNISKEKEVETTENTEGGKKDKRIDDNINKALKALKSPRLSVPQGTEPEISFDSAQKQKPEAEGEGSYELYEEPYAARQLSAGIPVKNLRDYGQDKTLKRWRSSTHSRQSRSRSNIRQEREGDKDDELAGAYTITS